MPPSPPPPPGPLDRPDASSSGKRREAAGFAKWLTPRSPLGILVIAGIAYSVLIDNPFRPGQESVLREAVREYAYWNNGGLEAQKLKASADVDDASRRAADAELAAINANSKLAPPVDLGIPFREQLPSNSAPITDDAYLNGSAFNQNLNDGIASKEEIPLLAEAWKRAVGKSSVEEALTSSTVATPSQIEDFSLQAQKIFEESGSSPEVAAAGVRALIRHKGSDR